LQLALYQRFYCRVARGSVWAVTVTDTERQAALMALVVRPFRRPLTVNMAKQRHMAVDTDMTPDVPAALMVSVKLMEPDMAQAASVKRVLVMVRAASVKPVQVMAQVASVKLAQVQAASALVQDLVKLDLVRADLVRADLVRAEQVSAKLVTAGQDLPNKLDTAGRASVKPDMAGQAQLARV
jgi:hypothetical protein